MKLHPQIQASKFGIANCLITPGKQIRPLPGNIQSSSNLHNPHRFQSQAYHSVDGLEASNSSAHCVDGHQGFESKVEKSPTIMMDTTPTILRTSPGRTESCITSRPPPLSLPNLPPELLLMLFSFLDYGTLLELGATNKHFRSLVSREHVVAALYRDEDVIRDATSLRDKQIACFKCYRLRSAFFDFDKRGIQPKFTAKGEQAGRRRCLICLMPTSPPMEKAVEKDGKRCSGRPDGAHSNKLRVVPHG
jgi:hypothetical protein